MYREDSFFTLTTNGQIGLVVLSTGLAIAVSFLIWNASKQRTLPYRLLIGVVAVVLFEWFSPQIYYFYYIFLLGVPWQIVIGAPPSILELARLLTFTDSQNLSFHSRGLFGWLLIFLAILSPILRGSKR